MLTEQAIGQLQREPVNQLEVRAQTLNGLFATQVAQRPAQPAVVSANKTL